MKTTTLDDLKAKFSHLSRVAYRDSGVQFDSATWRLILELARDIGSLDAIDSIASPASTDPAPPTPSPSFDLSAFASPIVRLSSTDAPPTLAGFLAVVRDSGCEASFRPLADIEVLDRTGGEADLGDDDTNEETGDDQ